MKRKALALALLLVAAAGFASVTAAVLDDGPPFSSKGERSLIRWCWLCRWAGCDCPEE
jgi:hypothetical protein